MTLAISNINESNPATSPARDYQIEAIEKLWRALHEHDGPVCLALGTGGGKTRIANDIVAKWLDLYGGRVVWIAKDRRLLEQASQDFEGRMGPEGKQYE